MARFYLLMRSHGQVSRIDVDSDETCQDHRHDPPLFHTVSRYEDGRPYTVALRCPTSLTRQERRRLFSSSTPMDQAEEILEATEREDSKASVRKNYDDLGLLLVALGATIFG